MKRVVGIGGIFFRSKDPKALSAWYKKHLGLATEDWGGAIFQFEKVNSEVKNGYQLWSPFKQDTDYFGSEEQSFMVNFIVDDLAALLDTLKKEGVLVIDRTEEMEFGKFGWCVDPEGNRIELWEPLKS